MNYAQLSAVGGQVRQLYSVDGRLETFWFCIFRSIDSPAGHLVHLVAVCCKCILLVCQSLIHSRANLIKIKMKEVSGNQKTSNPQPLVSLCLKTNKLHFGNRIMIKATFLTWSEHQYQPPRMAMPNSTPGQGRSPVVASRSRLKASALGV